MCEAPPVKEGDPSDDESVEDEDYDPYSVQFGDRKPSRVGAVKLWKKPLCWRETCEDSCKIHHLNHVSICAVLFRVALCCMGCLCCAMLCRVVLRFVCVALFYFVCVVLRCL